MINVRDIAKIEQKRKDLRKEIYTKIFEQFSRKIKQCVELGQKYATLTVPSFLLGYPTFDRELAASYLERQLVRAGFTVVREEYVFVVSWQVQSSKKALPPPPVPDPDPDEDSGFPTLMNLRKAANKYRRG
jgi:hypothetical protein